MSDRRTAAAGSIRPWEKHRPLAQTPPPPRQLRGRRRTHPARPQAVPVLSAEGSSPGSYYRSVSRAGKRSWDLPAPPHPPNPSLQVPADAVNGRHRNGAPQVNPEPFLPHLHQLAFSFASTLRNQNIRGFARQSHLKNTRPTAQQLLLEKQAKRFPHPTGWHGFDGEGARDGTPRPPPF